MSFRPRRVAVVCRKGGVGKTTTTVQLAAAISAKYACRVLVVDHDPQANTTSRLGVAEGQAPRTLNDVYTWTSQDWGSLSDAIIETPWEGVDLVASEEALKFRESEGDNPDYRLALAFERSSGLEKYPLVLIDTLPGTGSLLRNALIAADGMLAITDPEPDGLKGADKAVRNAREIARRQNPDLRVLGILVNRYDHAVGEHQRCVEDLMAAHPDLVWRPWLPERAAVKTARGLKRPVQEIKGSGAREYVMVMDDIAARLVNALNIPELHR
jgi:chromosome partitioning protein